MVSAGSQLAGLPCSSEVSSRLPLSACQIAPVSKNGGHPFLVRRFGRLGTVEIQYRQFEEEIA